MALTCAITANASDEPHLRREFGLILFQLDSVSEAGDAAGTQAPSLST